MTALIRPKNEIPHFHKQAFTIPDPVFMSHIYIWAISFLAVVGVIIRPFKIPEAVWTVAAAVLLVLLRLISPSQTLAGIFKGTDVYLFLTGMMLLSETAREEKLFDWLAAYAAGLAKGSQFKLFLLVYLVGVVITVFLSNDATAVVLTPAVAAAVKVAKVSKPLSYLFICAFIANAASFVLPISNPANLVIYGTHMPSLLKWLSLYSLPSLLSIVITFVLLFFSQHKYLKNKIETDISLPQLSTGGKVASAGIFLTAVVLLLSSALNIQLGLPAAVAGILTAVLVLVKAKKQPWVVIKGVSWAILPLVAGLFVIVEALNTTTVIQSISTMLRHGAEVSAISTTWISGFVTAFACNLMNNLPAGLIAGNIIQAVHVPETIKSAVLIGIDLGPNLSVTGSLATILWLVALRREGLNVSAWTFLKLGLLIMPVSLLFAIAAVFV